MADSRHLSIYELDGEFRGLREANLKIDRLHARELERLISDEVDKENFLCTSQNFMGTAA